MTVSVTIDGIVFSGDGSDENWVYSSMPGWYSSPPMRGSSMDLPSGDGSSPIGKAFRSARVLRFRGALRGATAAEALERWGAFAALQADGVPFPITVVDPLGSRTCVVSLDGEASVVEVTNLAGIANAVFVASDPVKYGPSRTLVTGLPSSGGGLEYPLHNPAGALSYGVNGDLGRISVLNSGTAEVWPVLSVVGGLGAGFFAQKLSTGQVVRYDRVVPAGSTVRVDFRTGEVIVDGGSDGSTYLTRSEFFSARPGEAFEVQFNAIGGSSGTPLMSITLADGYW